MGGEFLLKSIKDIAFKEGRYWLLCKWYGLEDIDDSWESMEEITERYRELVIDFLEKNKSNEVVDSLLIHLLSESSNKEVNFYP